MAAPHRPFPCLAGLLLTLLSCASDAPSGDPGRSDFPELRDSRGLALLQAIDAVEVRGELGAAPWLAGIWHAQRLGLDERARAAAALAALGFPSGQEACLALLGAWLPGQQAESRRLAIPRQEEMAFVREIAFDPLARRLEAAGREVPFYDVNQGAPQMLASIADLSRSLAGLPPPRPALPRAVLAELWPPSAPSSFPFGDWALIRQALLAELP